MSTMNKLSIAIALALATTWSMSINAAGNQAKQGGPRGQGLALQGTCLEGESGDQCNQRPEWQYNQQREQQQTQNQCLEDGTCLQDMVLPDAVSDVEAQGLAFMREEEKLARDVYKTLYEQWNTPIFANIAMSEQRHMDSVWQLMEQYGLEDSATDTIGQFNNAELQTLYNDLTARGQTSQLEALRVGALIEEVDIADLEDALAQTENPGIQVVYTNLMQGSENHLRSFVSNIENLGYTYTAQVLEAVAVDDILGTEEASTGFGISSNSMQMVATQTQFRPSVSTDNGQRGNGLNVKPTDTLRVGATIEPEPQHRGQPVDIMNVATFQASPNSEQTMFMRNQQGEWQPWDGNLANLEPAQSQQTLRQQQRVDVYEGQLPMQGNFRINVGYRLQDGTFIFNGDPIEFTVE